MRFKPSQSFSVDSLTFFPAVIILLSIVVAILILPEQSQQLFASIQATIVDTASWFYVLVMGVVLTLVVVLAFSRFGEIKLGPDHSTPDYGYVSWFAMLFSAGIGIGLLFFGVAEPVMHYLSPPLGEGGNTEAASQALRLTFFHWGFNVWATYAAVAMVLGYFAYRHNLPLTLRSAFYPLIGDRIFGPWGAAVDVFAIICTTFGIATSLGYGVLQINAGINYLFDVPVSDLVQVILIFVIMALAAVSVVMGLDAGIKRLSEINTVLAVLLLGGVLIVGPTVLLLSGSLQNFGGYLATLIPKTFNLYVYNPTDWLGGWTIFYWGWWISWTPFVGLFVARISRGRTIREFLIGVTIVPTLFIVLWMGIFGGSAIDLIANQGASGLGEAIQSNQAIGLFKFLDYLPGTQVLSMICLVMIVIFFVTSADSGALVLNMLSAHGNDDTPAAQRVFWAMIIAVIAATLLLAGGLGALQTATIASALPFSVALLGAFWGLWRALSVDGVKRDAAAISVHPPSTAESSDWRQRLDNLLTFSSQSSVIQFQRGVVAQALADFARELSRHHVDASIEDCLSEASSIRLVVTHGEEADFVYEVRAHQQPLPDESLMGEPLPSQAKEVWRAEVHLAEGGQDYDIMGWSKEQVLVDILKQYEDHLHFLQQLR